MPLELCPKCKGMHYKNAPCIVRVTKSTAVASDQHVEANTSRGLASPANAEDARTANTKDAPKFDKKTWMREYMRDHRKGIKRRAAQKEAKDGVQR